MAAATCRSTSSRRRRRWRWPPAWRRRWRSRGCRRPLRWVVAIVLASSMWRAGDDPFPKLASNVWHDTRYAIGRIDRRTHLARYGGRDVGQVLGARQRRPRCVLRGAHAAGRTGLRIRLLAAAYVYAERRSASRFFWSRPGDRRTSTAPIRPTAWRGCAADLARSRPAYIVLQMHDWPDVGDSAPFFLSQPALVELAACRLSPGSCDRRLPDVGAQRPMTRRALRGGTRSRSWPVGLLLRTLYPGGRSAVALDRGRRLARRRRVDAQRAQQGALRRLAPGRVESGLHRAGLHGARVSVVQGVRRRRPAGAAGQRARGAGSRCCCSRSACAGSPAIARR